MPTRDTVRCWCAEHDDFRQDYEAAEDFALQVLPDEMIDLADEFRPSVVEKVSRGRVIRVQTTEESRRCRLRVEVRWWVVKEKRLAKAQKGHRNDTRIAAG